MRHHNANIKLTLSVKGRRLKHVVSLRQLRIDGGNDGRLYVGLENVESRTGRLLNTPAADNGSVTTMVRPTSLTNAFEPGDVLFGKLRPYLGKAWIADFPGQCSTEFLVMRPVGIEARFLLYICLWSGFVDTVDALTFGSKMPRAEWTSIGNVLVPLPDRAKQRAISDYLDRETTRLDALVVEKERLLDLLAERRRALITRAVTRGLDPAAHVRDSGTPRLGESPAHWTRCHLKRVLESLDYGVSTPVGTSGNIAVLRMGDIQDGYLNYSRVGFAENVDDALLLQPGDLLFNRTNSLYQIGKVALFRGNCDYPVSFASYLVRFRCHRSVLPEFLNWLLNSTSTVAWMRAEALPAIGQVNLNPNRLGYLPVALPTLVEQEHIVSFLETEIRRLDTVRSAAVRTIAILKERRSALIAAAVTGQIDVSSAA